MFFVQFLDDSIDQNLLLDTTYEPVLVILSCIIAIFASYSALNVAKRIDATEGIKKYLWLCFGAITMGTGIWTMHFIGMTALKLSMQMSYDIKISIYSIIPAIFASGVALEILSKNNANKLRIILGGLFMGAGIGAMHFLGMEAMQMPATIYYSPFEFIMSIIIAVLLAIIALSIKFTPHNWFPKAIAVSRASPIIMGTAIAGMHYTAMAAANFYPVENNTDIAMGIDPMLIGGISGIAGFLIILSSVVAAFVDMRTLASQELKRHEAFLNTVLDTMMEGLIVIDEDALIKSINALGLKMFGYDRNEVIDQNVSMLMNTEDAKKHDGYISRYLFGEGANKVGGVPREFIGVMKNGEKLELELTVNMMLEQGKHFFVGSFRDISARKRNEQALINAKNKAEMANQTKSEFLANMSHEFRTPLNAILGFSEIFISEIFGPIHIDKYKEYAKDIHTSGQHLLDLTNDILNFSQIEAGMGKLNEEDIDVATLVNTVITFINGSALKKRVLLGIDLTDELRILHADPLKLRQILINLLSNSVKFTPSGGKIVLKVWCSENSGYVFQVIDTGIGIAFDDIPRVLEPFQQVGGTYNRTEGGTGLGLALVKSLAELHGGSLDLQSSLGIGTTVTVRFPHQRIR